MTELPKVEFHTYHSKNAPEERAWVSYIWTEDAGIWTIHFSGSCEAAVAEKATSFYEETKAKREATIIARAEARKKAEKTRAKKLEDVE